MQFVNIVEGTPKDFMSRLFVYYNARAMEGTINEDSGAMIRDGIKSVAKQGVCPEAMWPYDITQFNVCPPKPCYDIAAQETAVKYSRLGASLRGMKSTLAGGRPFVFGSTLYDGFEAEAVAKTGRVPMPGSGEQPVGGHAMLCVGYDDSIGCFIVRNSWGADWGDKGYCYMPYAYLSNANLTDDRWVIEKTSK